MKKKIGVLLLSTALVLGSLAGCGSAEKETASGTSQEVKESTEGSESTEKEETETDGAGTDATQSDPKVIRVGWLYEPETMNPANASTDAAYQVVRLCVEPLLRNVNGEAQPGLAESYEVSEDNLEYTFHLRESTYSDGTPVTAQDVAYSIEYTLNPENACENSYMIYGIKGAEAYNSGEGTLQDVGMEVLDDYTIKFTMCQTAFPLYFAQQEFAPMSQKFVESCGEQFGSEAEYTLTNGPFTLVTWTHDSILEMVKNENYWNADAINLEGITCYINATEETAVDMMTAGELDACEFTNANQVNSLEETGNFTSQTFYSGFQFMHINHKGKTDETGQWLGNTNFRKALSAAIDREAMVQAVYTTDEASSRLELPSALGVEKSVVEEYPYVGWSTTAEPEKAIEYLNAAMEELGCSDVSEIPVFTMLCYDSQSNMNAMNAIAAMWESNLGIRAEIDAQPLSSMVQKAVTGDYDFWKGGQANGYIDWFGDTGTEYLSTTGGPYFCSYEEYDLLYNKAATATDWKSRKDAMFELEQYYCENMLDLVITWIKGNLVTTNNITNVSVNGYVDYTYADMTE
ncbi:MAG: ABC transporter substrate-binding protein [Fusicatenibacter sp.]